MKKSLYVGTEHFHVSCKMPLCLRFGGVASGNGDRSSCDKCKGPSNLCATDTFRKENCECRRTKPSIFNALRKKWRRNMRRDRCETRKCGDPQVNMCHRNGSEVRSTCVKHHRLKSWGSTSEVANNVTASAADSSEGNPENREQSSALEGNEECSCFGSPSRRAFSNMTAKVVKLKAMASRSLSDISSTANISSQANKADSENDLSRVSSTQTDNATANAGAYSNGLCTESTENLELSYGIEESAQSCGLQSGQKIGNLTQELHKLSKYGWYWGPINRSEAESKLVDQPDGAFLVRDSSDDRYILSLSFRSYGKTLHTRIEHSNGLFSFYSQPEPEGHASIVELIKQSMCYSQSGVFCYSRSRSPGSPSFPVRLTKPISRFTQVRSLQYLCRFVIRQYTRFDHIQKLPLPERIKGYLEEGHY